MKLEAQRLLEQKNCKGDFNAFTNLLHEKCNPKKIYDYTQHQKTYQWVLITYYCFLYWEGNFNAFDENEDKSVSISEMLQHNSNESPGKHFYFTNN